MIICYNLLIAGTSYSRVIAFPTQSIHPSLSDISSIFMSSINEAGIKCHFICTGNIWHIDSLFHWGSGIEVDCCKWNLFSQLLETLKYVQILSRRTWLLQVVAVNSGSNQPWEALNLPSNWQSFALIWKPFLSSESSETLFQRWLCLPCTSSSQVKSAAVAALSDAKVAFMRAGNKALLAVGLQISIFSFTGLSVILSFVLELFAGRTAIVCLSGRSQLDGWG